MANALQLALLQCDGEDIDVEQRGPKWKGGVAAGQSPPKHKARVQDGADESAMTEKGVDPSAFATVRYLKGELKSIIESTVEDQNQRFEKRFA